MDYMFEKGFLGTGAPLFMDFVTLIVAFLPLLVYLSVLFVRRGMLKTHALTQNFLYVFAVIVVVYFEYGVRVGGGFDAFMSTSGVDYTYALVVLILHVITATLTFLYWTLTIIKANSWMKQRLLPGRNSQKHKIMALKSFVGIVFTSFSGIWVYLLLFVY